MQLLRFDERINRRVGHTVWIAACLMIIVGLMTTVVLVSMSRPIQVGDLGQTPEFAASSPPIVKVAAS